MAYLSRAALKTRLFAGAGSLGTLPDGEVDPILDSDLTTAAQVINNYCRRHFDLVTETRTFDAPAASELLVADLQPDPAPVVTQGGTALVEGTDYILQPQITALHPAYTYLVRVRAGLVTRWGYRPQRSRVVSVPLSRGGWADEYAAPPGEWGIGVPGASESTITIAGAWGYGATVPGPIQQATEMLCTRLWWARMIKYGDGQAGDAPTRPALLTQDIKDLLDPYVRSETGGDRGE